MTPDDQIALVARYFDAVDAQRLEDILDTLTEDCVFAVETHGVLLQSPAQISGMFHRLWANHRAVRHHSFRYLPSLCGTRIAAQFQVENTELDGSLTAKSNCNFFDLQTGRFARIAVYMAGPNTLDHGP